MSSSHSEVQVTEPTGTLPASSESADTAAMATVTEAPRENLISTAVNFLKNEKVRGSPLAQKKSFLAKKGLNTEEIEIAVQRAGVTETAVVAATPVQPPAVHQPQPVSLWSKTRDMIASGIVIGGLGYLLYNIYKRYIVPYLYGATPEQKQIEAVQKGIKELQDSVQQMLGALQQSMAAVQEKQESTLREISFQSTQGQSSEAIVRMQDVHSNSEIKQEIASLKALLLNRKQFPSAPPTTPVLPAWQRPSLPPADSPEDASPADPSVQAPSPSSDNGGPAGPSQSIASSAQPGQADGDAQQSHVPLVGSSADSHLQQNSASPVGDSLNASAADGQVRECTEDLGLKDETHDDVQEQDAEKLQTQSDDQH